tara:strand:- start:218 stop:616 length:399 start_codon:yes stop_codon:yes gene_type:complete
MDLEILNIASDTDNNRIVKNFTHYSKLKNSMCGDEINIQLIIKENKIVDFGYHGQSCIYCQATASLLSKICINNHKAELANLCENVEFFFDDGIKKTNKKWLILEKIFNKRNLPRRECILLPFKTLKKIVSI